MTLQIEQMLWANAKQRCGVHAEINCAVCDAPVCREHFELRTETCDDDACVARAIGRMRGCAA